MQLYFIFIFIKFTQTNFRNFLTNWIIAEDQPFTTTESKHFQNMVKVLNPDAKIPKADAIKGYIMDNFNEEREKRKILFQVMFKYCKNNFKLL